MAAPAGMFSAARGADGSVAILDVQRGDKIDFEVPALPLPNTTKNTAGYPLAPGMDWIDLFVGSEGTLGIVMEAELQLLPAPRDVLAGVVFSDRRCGGPGCGG